MVAVDRYPYPRWFDGRIHRLTRGIDYQVKTASLASLLYARARRDGWNITILQRKGGTVIVFQVW